MRVLYKLNLSPLTLKWHCESHNLSLNVSTEITPDFFFCFFLSWKLFTFKAQSKSACNLTPTFWETQTSHTKSSVYYNFQYSSHCAFILIFISCQPEKFSNRHVKNRIWRQTHVIREFRGALWHIIHTVDWGQVGIDIFLENTRRLRATAASYRIILNSECSPVTIECRWSL